MKTTKFKFVLFLMLAALACSVSFAQSDFTSLTDSNESSSMFSAIVLDDLKAGGDIPHLDNEVITVDYYEGEGGYTLDQVLGAMAIGFGVGLGFGEGDSLYCLHANLLFRLAMFKASVLYGALGLLYDGFSNDFFTQSLLAVSAYLIMYTALTRYREVFLLWGALGSYAFGTEKNEGSSIKYDLTRLTLGALLGLSVVLSPQWSIALYTTILTYQSWTQKYEGIESKSNSTFFLLNKSNVFTLSLVYFFAMNSRAQRSAP